MRRVLRILLFQLLSLVLLAGAAAGAWAAWLGWDQEREVSGDTETGPYAVWQVGGLVLTLLVAVAVVAYVRHFVPAVLGSTAGLTFASYYDWSDDNTGLFAVGVALILMGTFVGSALVAVAVGAVRGEPDAGQGAFAVCR
ncbi:hypothetical protein DMB38_21530 [Streptomyces sp. WAC 06738]|uniref:hypothetical protein n=1 Tax=Streptomyces sp. WAC 06738 TaxID=2203210 RepID=UPI000F6E387B|nr:hypothetical protein [Streptomyces sp. WAC 06738]AZM48021.1 hypothetical protein DMB38_21530 [Streptomyces sp. WAC 06738]